MKNITTFTAAKVKDGYEVFVYWEKRYRFPNTRIANAFLAKANNLLFTELFKVNELFIELFPEVQRQMFVAKPKDKILIMNCVESIQSMFKYCHFSQGPGKTVYVIAKLEQCYSELKKLNDVIFYNSKKASNTIDVYRSKVFAERLESSLKDFLDFKFVRLEKLVKQEEMTELKIAV